MGSEDLSSNTSPNPSPETPQPEELKPHPELKQIRTYQGDVAGAIQDNNESLVSIQRAEHLQGALTHTAQEAKISKFEGVKKGVLLFLGTVILVLLGAAGSWYAYTQYQIKTAVPELAASPNRFVTSIEEVRVNALGIDRSELISHVSEAALSDPGLGQVRHIQLARGQATSTLITSRELFEILDGSEPSRLVRAFHTLFMLGALGVTPLPAPLPVVTTTSTSSPQASTATSTLNQATSTASTTQPIATVQPVGQSVFLIMQLESFDNAFAGMLEWEKSMAIDIGPLFSTAPYISALPLDATFKDETRYNKDLRVLRTNEGQVVLLYTFFNNDKLIITDKEETMRILLSRLENELLSQ